MSGYLKSLVIVFTRYFAFLFIFIFHNFICPLYVWIVLIVQMEIMYILPSTWVKLFRIVPEFRILRLTFCGKSFFLSFFLSFFTGSLIHEHYTRECEFGNFDKIKKQKTKKKKKKSQKKTQKLLAEFLFK